MRTIKFEEKKIKITSEDTIEVFTLHKSTEIEGNVQFIMHEGRTFYLTEIISK